MSNARVSILCRLLVTTQQRYSLIVWQTTHSIVELEFGWLFEEAFVAEQEIPVEVFVVDASSVVWVRFFFLYIALRFLLTTAATVATTAAVARAS